LTFRYGTSNLSSRKQRPLSLLFTLSAHGCRLAALHQVGSYLGYTSHVASRQPRKHCVKAFVPLPPQGHWNKVQAGQTVKTIPLPPRPPGVTDETTIGQRDYRESKGV
jgi:hypothetical protein